MTTDRELRELLRLVVRTRPDELDCDEVLERTAACLGSLGPDGELPAELRHVAQHLEVCRECREEFLTLLDVYGMR